jgi:[protein-PII] uridylyltransferase
MTPKQTINTKEDSDIKRLSESIKKKNAITTLKVSLAEIDSNFTKRFIKNEAIEHLVHLRSLATDEIILHLWGANKLNNFSDIALIAVGGYGREELHPKSDIDIMILLKSKISKQFNESVSNFLTNLWDLGFDLGHSVRTLKECKAESKKDLITITTLMESRLLSGDKNLHNTMKKNIKPNVMWSSKNFYAAKRKEQIERHLRSDNTAYKLEPNIKLSPGGLRDIQLIGWVAKRHFQVNDINELIEHKFLTIGQLKILNEGRRFLWKIRYGLHVIANRREDRLLFDHQKNLAEMLGYEDATFTLAVEQMMQRYYRTVMDLSRINEMLLQQFEEAILLNPNAKTITINDSFQIKNGYLQAAHDEIFEENPSGLLDIFLLLQQESKVIGVSAYTIGLIKRNLHLIDDEFRQNPKNHRLFLSILKAPQGVTHELRRMNLYGVLGLYIPAFGRIVGRMQYDLFHAYTVDEHTLFVVSNLRRFALSRFDHEYPHCSKLMQSLEKPEIAYLAGLFHDIAKGRGGDHSELGAIDAEAFCLEHGMSKYSAKTVAWLVKHHLLLSMTAQKKDISDPSVIHNFSKLIGDKLHLDYLYILTIADIRGTNPNLWNSWKATLLYDLYSLTKRALRSESENPIDRDQLIAEKKSESLELLMKLSIKNKEITTIWNLHKEEYFIRYRANEIAWHTEKLLHNDNCKNGFIDIREQINDESIQIVLYTPQSMRTFVATTGILDELGMNILDARIVPMNNDFSMDTFIFINSDNINQINQKTLVKIKSKLSHFLENSNEPKIQVSRRVSRKVKHFSTKPEVIFKLDKNNNRTILEIVTKDRPGLLFKIGQVFTKLNINIEAAKIVTIGEKAEDVFFIVDKCNMPLSKKLTAQLKNALIEYITE